MRHMVNGQIGEWRTEADGSVRFHPIRESTAHPPAITVEISQTYPLREN